MQVVGARDRPLQIEHIGVKQIENGSRPFMVDFGAAARQALRVENQMDDPGLRVGANWRPVAAPRIIAAHHDTSAIGRVEPRPN